MTKYKKEAPKRDPWDGFVTPNQRIEHYLALILHLFDAVGHDNVTKEEVEEIIGHVREIWDLVPELCTQNPKYPYEHCDCIENHKCCHCEERKK